MYSTQTVVGRTALPSPHGKMEEYLTMSNGNRGGQQKEAPKQTKKSNQTQNQLKKNKNKTPNKQK